MHHFYSDIFKKCRRHERWQDMSYLNSLFQESLFPGYSELEERYICTFTYDCFAYFELIRNHRDLKFLTLSSFVRFTVGYSKPTKITMDSFEGLELNYKVYVEFVLNC